jgi:hypothetical protein
MTWTYEVIECGHLWGTEVIGTVEAKDEHEAFRIANEEFHASDPDDCVYVRLKEKGIDFSI